MTEPVISFDHIYKKFAMGEQHTTLRDLVAASFGKLFGRGPTADPAQLRNQEFWAVKDLSFELKKGESLGIIGPNGSGKSTTLKLLSGILRPDRGTYNVKGRLSALIEVGAGFHPDLTGRENVYLNGAILGLSRKQIDDRFDGIVAFSGIEQFIDSPVKNYSSGMYVRLGFSVAINVDPDVLLIDEVLAVGDEAFQRKCEARIAERVQEGATLVLVSHDAALVERTCERVVVLDGGAAVFDGPAAEGMAHYHEMMGTVTA